MSRLVADRRVPNSLAASRPYLPFGVSPALLALDKSSLLREHSRQRFATLFSGEYNDKSRLLRYVNCGHLPALLLRGDDHLERLEPTCTVLGLFKSWDCSTGERSLSPGDIVVFYTDGVTELFNEADEQFGESRLVEALRQLARAERLELQRSRTARLHHHTRRQVPITQGSHGDSQQLLLAGAD